VIVLGLALVVVLGLGYDVAPPSCEGDANDAGRNDTSEEGVSPPNVSQGDKGVEDSHENYANGDSECGVLGTQCEQSDAEAHSQDDKPQEGPAGEQAVASRRSESQNDCQQAVEPVGSKAGPGIALPGDNVTFGSCDDFRHANPS